VIQVLLWLPLAAGLACFIVPRRLVPVIAVLGTLGTLGLAIAVVADFNSAAAGLQQTVSESWIPDLGVRYELGVDGISLFLVLLTAVLWVGGTAFSAFRMPERRRIYFFMLGLAETGVLGAFLAQDLLLFVLFFDLMLVPFWFLIGAFGGENRIAATTKLIVYTLVGSLLMFVAAIATAVIASGDIGHLSFSLADLRANPLSTGSQYWTFWFFAAAFLIKMPAFLVHGWMPDTYREAPLPVLALFSAVLSKVAAYGFLRIVLPVYPQATVHFQEVLLVIALAGILYGSVMAFTVTNVRLIAGYSSIAQLGFITLGIFSLRPDGADGAVLQMVNHGLVVGGIFLIVALLWERSGSEDLTRLGGLATRAPVLASLFLIITLGTLAMPGSANFIGEFYILIGVFQSKIVFAFVASLGIVLAAYYSIRLFQGTMHNRRTENVDSREIGLRDAVVIAPLVACIVALALYPGLIVGRADSSVEATTAAVRPDTSVIAKRGWTGYAPVSEVAK
jgi:NADH-quinone oxidoreductase subunit M